MQSSEFLVSGWEDGSDQGCGWTREGRNGGGCVNEVVGLETADEDVRDLDCSCDCSRPLGQWKNSWTSESMTLQE
jgi:hypothetical protein